MTVKGITWTAIGGGQFLSPIYKGGFYASMLGCRGNWGWTIKNNGFVVSFGRSNTKLAGMAECADQLKESIKGRRSA